MNQRRLRKQKRKTVEKDVCLKDVKRIKGRNKIIICIMNCAAPAVTAAFLAGSICWASELRYDRRTVYNESPGIKAASSPKGAQIDFSGHIEMDEPEISSGREETGGAELVEAFGVYVDGSFIGAVVSGERIREELEKNLEEYKSDENIISADYAVETEIKDGIYRSSALVPKEEMTDYLSGEKEIVTEYETLWNDTPQKVAEDFGMTVEEVIELNPDIEEIEEGQTLKIKETVSVLPVKYTCEETEKEDVEIEILCSETGDLIKDEDIGEKGIKVSTYEVTYIDGTEISRRLKEEETLLEPLEDSEVKEEMPVLYTESLPEQPTEAVNFIWPVDGGYVSDPFLSDRNHKGMDIAAEGGTDIYASAPGMVIEAGWNDGGYGNYVVIEHSRGYSTLYAHAREVYVSKGQTVEAGDLIAAVGTTGDSTGNHCHFEIMYKGDYLNPDAFVTKE